MTNPESTLPPGDAQNAHVQGAHPASSGARDPRDTNSRSTDLGSIARAALPPARRFVRRHPYAGILGAAVVGVWLVRGKPLRTLGSSALFGLAARRLLASLPSGVFARRRPAPTSRGASNPPR